MSILTPMFTTTKKTKGETREAVKYWYKNPTEEFMASVASIVNGNEIDPNEIVYINHCAGGDHADVKFQMLAKTIIRTVTGKTYVDIYSLADVLCKKNNGDILSNTVLKHMILGMNKIAAGKLIFKETIHQGCDEIIKEYVVELVEEVDEAPSTGVVKNP